MKIEELKKLMNKSTAVLVMDNGDPSFVLLGYEAYKDLILGKNQEIEKEVKVVRDSKATSSVVEQDGQDNLILSQKMGGNENELEILERINKDIQILRGEIEKEEKLLNVD